MNCIYGMNGRNENIITKEPYFLFQTSPSFGNWKPYVMDGNTCAPTFPRA